MGIGWLWHFTHASETDTLRVRNEERAAAFHARWRALHRLVASPLHRLRDAHRERLAARELDALTDDVLRDVGLHRDVDGTVAAAPREWNGPRVPASGASRSTLDRPRTHEPAGGGRCIPFPSFTDRPEPAPRRDAPGQHAA